MEMNFASRGVGAAALTTGIIGTAGTALNLLGNGLGGLFGGGCNNGYGVNHYELGMQNEIANKDMEIAYLRGRDASKSDDLELYKYVDGRFRSIEAQIASQAVVNAQITANLSCLQNSVAALNALTKTVIPITNVCPLPATATTTTTG